MKEGSITPKSGAWAWSPEHAQAVQVLEVEELFDQRIARVWLPRQKTTLRVDADQLRPMKDAPPITASRITYLVTAARLADSLAQDVLLAPMASAVIPLPHQIKTLQRAMAKDHVRYMYAGEVGMGKTIEAGLTAKELKLRGMAKRILVLAPMGLCTQWVAEMETHFGEKFNLVKASDLDMLKRMTPTENAWKVFDQVICPMDSVKPLEKRQGWSREKVALFNQDRFEAIIAAGWDLIIIDEAHRLGGSSDNVARYKLGRGLAEAAPYLLLLSATPHQGKTDAFHRLMALLDPMAFPDVGAVTRERVAPFVIRTEKRAAIDAQGNPLFKPRVSKLVSVEWGPRHRDQKILYEAVTEYVREGYNQSVKEKKPYLGFLMILMQRLVTSSTRAIRITMEKRLAALEEEQEQAGEQMNLLPAILDDEWSELDGQEQIENLVRIRIRALKNEREEVRLLLALAKRVEGTGTDAKAEALVDHLYQLQQDEGDPNLKALIFTEFAGTQEMLSEYLQERGFSICCLNGTLDMDQRRLVQRDFATKSQILISTDAGGEGLNLQFAHVVFNFDVPWNPMRLEQRIGRVDRIGQKHIVKAFNFVLAETVEHRVQEVIEAKLQVILKEIGIDKTSDLLDSAEGAELFDQLFVGGLMNPDSIDNQVEEATKKIAGEVQSYKEAKAIIGDSQQLDPKAAAEYLDHPVQHWIERMVRAYLEGQGGKVDSKNGMLSLRWPNRHIHHQVAFTQRDVEDSGATLLGLEDERIRGITTGLYGEPIRHELPLVFVAGLPDDLFGWWAMWKVSIKDEGWSGRRFVPVFVRDDGKSFPRTAKHIWDALVTDDVMITEQIKLSDPQELLARLKKYASDLAAEEFKALRHEHQIQIQKESEKAEYAFTRRRVAVSRLGLPAVRQHRLAEIDREEERWRLRLNERSQIIPDLDLIVTLVIRGMS